MARLNPVSGNMNHFIADKEKISYKDKKAETLPKEQLEEIQLKKIKQEITQALRSPFYRKHLSDCGLGLSEEIRSISSVAKLPFTEKNDLREWYPQGLLAVPMSEVTRVHASSGTTGTPTIVYLSMPDVMRSSEIMARCLVSIGLGSRDIVQNMMSYGLFTGGMVFHGGAERIGAAVIPSGSGNTIRQLKLMKDLHTTVIHATPGYLQHLSYVMHKEGYRSSDFTLRAAVTGAEPHTELMRNKLEALFGIPIFNCYGMSEFGGPGTGFECIFQTGMHVQEDNFFIEIINPDTGEVLPEGSIGELVVTTLGREAMPLIRYRTRDITRIIPGTCPCGRTHRRIDRFTGRTDDMLIINGVNVFPSQIEEVLGGEKYLGTNYRLIIERTHGRDQLTVQAELCGSIHAGSDSCLPNSHSNKQAISLNLSTKIAALITITPVIALLEEGTLPVSSGKACRVEDRRRLI